MSERYYPNDEQLFRLYNLLTFLKKIKRYWHDITVWGSTIMIKTEPPKGEIDLGIFRIYQDGRIDDDDFRRD